MDFTNAPMVTSMKTSGVQMAYYSARKPTDVKVRPMSTVVTCLTAMTEFIRYQTNAMHFTHVPMEFNLTPCTVRKDYISIRMFTSVIGRTMWTVSIIRKSIVLPNAWKMVEKLLDAFKHASPDRNQNPKYARTDFIGFQVTKNPLTIIKNGVLGPKFLNFRKI